MPLTDIALKRAQPRDKSYRLYDSGGLYVEVAPSGGKWWRLKYRFGRKEKRLSLGAYPRTSLKDARERRDEMRRVLADGRDPSQERKAEKLRQSFAAESSLEAVARAWVEHQSGAWNAESKARILASMEADVFPVLGSRPIAEVKAREVAAIVKGVESRGAGDTALRLLQRIKSVFRFAVITERIEVNPTLDLKPSEVLKPRRVSHRAALPESELTGFLARLDACDCEPSTANALRLLILTAVRPGELRGARWAEIDLEAARWRIPAERMKMRTEHVVPLSKQAVEVLKAMQPLSGHRELVFPSPYRPGKPLSEGTLNSALARMGYKGIATAHGFRSLFSTVANECGHAPDAIERQLAHVDRDKVRAAYHRAAHLPQRAKLMQWWANYLDGKRAGVVVPINQRAA